MTIFTDKRDNLEDALVRVQAFTGIARRLAEDAGDTATIQRCDAIHALAAGKSLPGARADRFDGPERFDRAAAIDELVVAYGSSLGGGQLDQRSDAYLGGALMHLRSSRADAADAGKPAPGAAPDPREQMIERTRDLAAPRIATPDGETPREAYIRRTRGSTR